MMQGIGSTKKETEFRKQMMMVVQESELILNTDQDVPKAPLSEFGRRFDVDLRFQESRSLGKSKDTSSII